MATLVLCESCRKSKPAYDMVQDDKRILGYRPVCQECDAGVTPNPLVHPYALLTEALLILLGDLTRRALVSTSTTKELQRLLRLIPMPDALLVAQAQGVKHAKTPDGHAARTLAALGGLADLRAATLPPEAPKPPEPEAAQAEEAPAIEEPAEDVPSFQDTALIEKSRREAENARFMFEALFGASAPAPQMPQAFEPDEPTPEDREVPELAQAVPEQPAPAPQALPAPDPAPEQLAEPVPAPVPAPVPEGLAPAPEEPASDPHTLHAAQRFNVPPEQVTKEQRSYAKQEAFVKDYSAVEDPYAKLAASQFGVPIEQVTKAQREYAKKSSYRNTPKTTLDGNPVVNPEESTLTSAEDNLDGF